MSGDPNRQPFSFVLQGTKHADPKLFFKNKKPSKMSQDPEKEMKGFIMAKSERKMKKENPEKAPQEKKGGQFLLRYCLNSRILVEFVYFYSLNEE
jgi:hypothetical protein